MKPFSGSEEEPASILSSFFRCISGNSLLRSRNTAVSLMRSMRCSELARARTSSTTASWGVATAGRGFDCDGAADLVDIGAHHVHADAAAGYAGDRRRGGEARREDELV